MCRRTEHGYEMTGSDLGLVGNLRFVSSTTSRKKLKYIEKGRQDNLALPMASKPSMQH